MRRYYLGVLGLTFMLLVTLAMASLQGCATTMSAQDTYLAALKQYNAEVERYETYYQASTAEEQAVYKAEVDPLILQAGEALDVWRAAVLLGNGDGSELNAYLDAKNAMIDALAKAYSKN